MARPSSPNEVRAPMTARIVQLEPALVLEAMKMEHAVKAPESGTVTRLAVAAGDQVQVDQLLAVVSPLT